MITYKFLSYPVTSKFGAIDNAHALPHTGLDIATPAGTPIQSLTDGFISQVYNDPNSGETVRVVADGGREWLFGHLQSTSVHPGQFVQAGQQLGLSGGVPGTFGAGKSTGAHLHLATYQGGQAVDPAQALAQPSGGGIWDAIHQLITGPMPGPMDIFLNWLGHGLHTLVAIMPEVAGLFAMGFLLVGMLGSQRAMKYAGTSTLLMFVGVILNAAIQG